MAKPFDRLETKMTTPTNTKTTTMYDDTGSGFTVTFSTSNVRGRSEITKLTVEAIGDESIITQKFLRSLPLATITRTMRREENNASLSASSAVSLDKWQGTDEQLRVVAELYREAYRNGVPVQPYLASRTGRPVTTVNRWIRQARERGHLGKSNGTRAGEWA